ncbi:MAG: transposase family protein [Candidatus Pacebacteria bacterium]|nr:transposase family protein [Candidatus Paceibacterota bacterium]
MNDEHVTSVAQLAELIKAAKSLGVDRVERHNSKEEVYAWITGILQRLRYAHLKRKERGTVRTYLTVYSGYTPSHTDHLIGQYRKCGKIVRAKRTQPRFERIYTRADIELLATVADAYEHQNGKALRKAMREMYHVYGDERFERLACLSTSHLYALKKTPTFKEAVLTYTKTRPVQTPIGERKKPYPEGKPGYIRVDSVHQGDRDKEKGVYHINLVDEVTQHEIVVCVEGISEQFLLPALEEALESFPYVLINFHSDNGSEYINKQVAHLLEKLRVGQTKSRARHSNDNALAEGKNAAVIRKHMGRMHIPRKHAPLINAFYQKYLNPFVNFHRFCAFPDEVIDAKGKITKVYDTYLTPVQKLLSLPKVEQYLKPDVTKEVLEKETARQSHLAAAQAMQKAKTELFKLIKARNVL